MCCQLQHLNLMMIGNIWWSIYIYARRQSDATTSCGQEIKYMDDGMIREQSLYNVL
jgi:hypothetical protein